MNAPDIYFPNLGIGIQNLSRVAFTVFGIDIYWYAICVMTGYVAALVTLRAIAKRTDQDPDMYSDYILYCLVFGLLGARIYYIIFSFDHYRNDLLQIFNTREGGLGIYGGLILTGLVTIRFVKKRGTTYGLLSDTAGPAIAIGQFFGRIGNLFNREAFGGFSNNLLAVRFKTDQVPGMPAELTNRIFELDGVSYIQVHPVFLYEMLWNLALFLFLLFYRKRKKFDGQIFLLYIIGYGAGRFWMEGLRTDQLKLFGSGIAVSQLLSALLVAASVYIMLRLLKRPAGGAQAAEDETIETEAEDEINDETSEDIIE
ncbi:MAG: prolipoprotein diacylglyceryl transferase [Clostridiales bacterium]|nr:prolipoprotein diacylglyceryl transferase [Clostridiales bacterium]